MIPEFDVEYNADFDSSDLRMPEEGLMKHETGLLCNHHYSDMRGMSWDEAKEALEIEKHIVEQADQKSRTKDEFEEAINRLVDEKADNWVSLKELEVGVAAATIVFSAAGGAPVSSCRGHQLNEKPHPYIGGWIDKKQADILINICKDCNVSISSYIWEHNKGVIISSRNIKEMMVFAERMIENARCFQQEKKKQDNVQHSLKEYQS